MNSWQNIVALLCVAWATGYLLWRTWQALRHPQRSSCSTCSQSKTGIRPSPLVSVEDLLQSSSARQHQDDSSQNDRASSSVT